MNPAGKAPGFGPEIKFLARKNETIRKVIVGPRYLAAFLWRTQGVTKHFKCRKGPRGTGHFRGCELNLENKGDSK